MTYHQREILFDPFHSPLFVVLSNNGSINLHLFPSSISCLWDFYTWEHDESNISIEHISNTKIIMIEVIRLHLHIQYILMLTYWWLLIGWIQEKTVFYWNFNIINSFLGINFRRVNQICGTSNQILRGHMLATIDVYHLYFIYKEVIKLWWYHGHTAQVFSW